MCWTHTTCRLLRLYLRTSTPVTPVTPDCQVRIRAIPIIRILPEYPVPGRTLVRRSAYCYFLTLVTRSILQLVIVLSFYYCFIITIRTQVYKLRTLYRIPQFKYQLGLSLNSYYSSDPFGISPDFLSLSLWVLRSPRDHYGVGGVLSIAVPRFHILSVYPGLRYLVPLDQLCTRTSTPVARS